MFALIYLYGLRVGEVALLARGDVDLERGRILVRRLKGGTWSERPLFASLAILLADCPEIIASRPDAPLFRGRSGPLKKRRGTRAASWPAQSIAWPGVSARGRRRFEVLGVASVHHGIAHSTA